MAIATGRTIDTARDGLPDGVDRVRRKAVRDPPAGTSVPARFLSRLLAREKSAAAA